jgi:putative transposase
VDTTGLVWGLAVTPADVHDTKGAFVAVAQAKDASGRLAHVWADSAFQGFVAFAAAILSIVVTIVTWKRKPRRFRVQKRRWVVERTFAWLGRSRRLSKDYEGRPATHEAWVQVAMIHLMLKRLAPP